MVDSKSRIAKWPFWHEGLRLHVQKNNGKLSGKNVAGYDLPIYWEIILCVCVFWRVGLQNDIENDSIYNIQSKGNNKFYKSHNMEQHNEIFVLACWVLPKKDEIWTGFTSSFVGIPIPILQKMMFFSFKSKKVYITQLVTSQFTLTISGCCLNLLAI